MLLDDRIRKKYLVCYFDQCLFSRDDHKCCLSREWNHYSVASGAKWSIEGLLRPCLRDQRQQQQHLLRYVTFDNCLHFECWLLLGWLLLRISVILCKWRDFNKNARHVINLCRRHVFAQLLFFRNILCLEIMNWELSLPQFRAVFQPHLA